VKYIIIQDLLHEKTIFLTPKSCKS